jgi:hypothetical protein
VNKILHKEYEFNTNKNNMENKVFIFKKNYDIEIKKLIIFLDNQNQKKHQNNILQRFLNFNKFY